VHLIHIGHVVICCNVWSAFWYSVDGFLEANYFLSNLVMFGMEYGTA
jgi:hypothetical protein